jgi:hypothetical protein
MRVPVQFAMYERVHFKVNYGSARKRNVCATLNFSKVAFGTELIVHFLFSFKM